MIRSKSLLYFFLLLLLITPALIPAKLHSFTFFRKTKYAILSGNIRFFEIDAWETWEPDALGNWFNQSPFGDDDRFYVQLLIITTRYDANFSNTYNITVLYHVLYVHMFWNSTDFLLMYKEYFSLNETETIQNTTAGFAGDFTIKNIDNTAVPSFVYILFKNGSFLIELKYNSGFTKYSWDLYPVVTSMKIGLEDTYGELGFHIRFSQKFIVDQKADFYIKPITQNYFYMHEKDRNFVEQLFNAITNLLAGAFSGLLGLVQPLLNFLWSLLPAELKNLVGFIGDGIILVSQLVYYAFTFTIMGIELYIYLTVFELISLLLYVIDEMLEGNIWAISVLAEFFRKQIKLAMKVIEVIHAIVNTIIPI